METLLWAWGVVALYFLLVRFAPPSPAGTAIDDEDFTLLPQGINHGLDN